MVENQAGIQDIVKSRNDMLIKQKKLYVSAVTQINMQMRELLKNNFGSTLVKNCARDIVGEIVRRYFDTADYYITVDQMFERVIHFSYDNDMDLLNNNEGIRKAYYNINDSQLSSTLKNITETCKNAQTKLFVENRSQDILDRKGKKTYRDQKTTSEGKLYDELTGREAADLRDLHADHIQARATINFNSKYIRGDKIENLKEFYNSSDNMQLIHASANTSKGDVRVCEINGEIKYLNSKEMVKMQNDGMPVVDITSKATSEQLTEAIVSQWEKDTSSGNKKETLRKEGYLDENGKVKPEIKKQLERNIRHSQNQESLEILKDANYKVVAKDAASEARKSLKKILAGQVIYYVLPPLVFETKSLLSRKTMTLDAFFSELKTAGKRIIRYVTSKLSEIFKNIAGNAINKFIKTFFDIIIEMVKATVKKLLKVIKQLVIALVNCVHTLMDKKSSALEKADAITKTLSVTINGVVVELLFEYLEKQFALPDFIMEPLKIIVTLLSTNLIMLILEKADLFDVRYGLLVSNIEKAFNEENDLYLEESSALFFQNAEEVQQLMEDVTIQITNIQETITQINVFETDITPEFEKLNRIFNMEIDFNKEWQEFILASI